MECGRPLERGLFRWCFEDGSVADVLDALSAHQDQGGGFRAMGEGPIEAASPIGTSVAFQRLADIGASPQCPLVQRGIRYFLDTYDHRHSGWPQKFPDDGYLENDLPLHWGNPSAEIVGYLWRYRKLVPVDFLAEITHVAMANFRQVGREMPCFSDLCFLRFAAFAPEEYRREIIGELGDGIVQANALRDRDKWGRGYFMKPYWYAPSPDGPLAAVLRDAIDDCLDFDIRTQKPDGSAHLTFHAEGEAKRLWKSIWTLESLRVLRAYGRIEGVRP
jgi:hypothetical protein